MSCFLSRVAVSFEVMDISVVEAARLLNISTKTLRRYIHLGKIEAVRLPGKYGEELRINVFEVLKQFGITPKSLIK